MTTRETDRRLFRFVGGRLCLDFVNTMGNYHDPTRRSDYLADYADLVAWGEHAGALEPTQAAVLLRVAANSPAEAAAVLTRARELRQAIREVTLAAWQGQPAPATDLATLNTFVTEHFTPMQLVPIGSAYALERGGDPAALDAVLWPIVRSAVELLTSEELGRVKECEDDACGWLFVDASRGSRRRWCAMDDCGNVAKARRHRARARESTFDAYP